MQVTCWKRKQQWKWCKTAMKLELNSDGGGASPRRRNASILPLQNKPVGAKKLELKNQAGRLDKASYLLET